VELGQEKAVLDAQEHHWQTTFIHKPEMFGGVGAQWELPGAVARGDPQSRPRSFDRILAHLSAIPPPRGRPGECPIDLPFRIEYLDVDRLLPVLVRKAA
jgi:hypothetical protein